MTEEIQNEVDYKLPPEQQKRLSEIIEAVISDYNKESKYYTADTLHFIRSKITNQAKAEMDIVSVDVILDLRHVEDLRFGFKVNIPVPKEEEVK